MRSRDSQYFDQERVLEPCTTQREQARGVAEPARDQLLCGANSKWYRSAILAHQMFTERDTDVDFHNVEDANS